jgi:hypothetical protein
MFELRKYNFFPSPFARAQRQRANERESESKGGCSCDIVVLGLYLIVFCNTIKIQGI